MCGGRPCGLPSKTYGEGNDRLTLEATACNTPDERGLENEEDDQDRCRYRDRHRHDVAPLRRQHAGHLRQSDRDRPRSLSPRNHDWPEQPTPDQQETENRRRSESWLDQWKRDRHVASDNAGSINACRLEQFLRKIQEERVEEINEEWACDEWNDLDQIGIDDLDSGEEQE